jgi:WD40 repeat protein
VRTLVFSPDGNRLASAGDDRQIVTWKVATGQVVSRIAGHPHTIYGIAYNPEGTQLAAVGFGDKVHLYDTRSGGLVRRLDGPGTDLRTVVFSPDGRQLATAGRNGQIRAWAMPQCAIEFDVMAGSGRVRTLAYLPEGDKLVSAGDGRTISIWNARGGDEHHRFTCPAGKVLSMVVCGESLIATGGSDNLVRVWNWQTKTEVDRLSGHTGSVATLAYDAASRVIISGSYDTTVRVWRLDIAGAEPADPGATRPGPHVR